MAGRLENGKWTTAFFDTKSGALLHSLDAGSSWSRIEGTGDKSLFAVDFDGPRRGVAVGLEGDILLTTDGGASWKKSSSSTGQALYAVRLRGAEAWAVGDAGTVLRSSDGGASWAPLAVADDVKLSWLHGVSFAGGRLTVVGAGGLVLSRDAGGEAHS